MWDDMHRLALHAKQVADLAKVRGDSPVLSTTTKYISLQHAWFANRNEQKMLLGYQIRSPLRNRSFDCWSYNSDTIIALV